MCVSNDHYIDMTLNKYESPVNEHGDIDANNDYTIHAGDTIHVVEATYWHKSCHNEYVAEITDTKVRELFVGFENVRLMRIPNEYHNDIDALPWYLVATDVGNFKIGWRNRVINIEYTTIPLDFNRLFDSTKLSVTVGSNYIHAWSYEQAKEFLTTIRTTLLPVFMCKIAK